MIKSEPHRTLTNAGSLKAEDAGRAGTQSRQRSIPKAKVGSILRKMRGFPGEHSVKSEFGCESWGLFREHLGVGWQASSQLLLSEKWVRHKDTKRVDKGCLLPKFSPWMGEHPEVVCKGNRRELMGVCVDFWLQNRLLVQVQEHN